MFRWQYNPYDQAYTDKAYRHVDENGRRYRRGDLTAAKPGGDVSYGWPVKRLAGGEWEADLNDDFNNPQEGWEYIQVPPYKNRYWAFSKENMRSFAERGRLVYASTGTPELKRYLDEQRGVPLQNDWNDLLPVSGHERLGYPTQKPISLLERIITASSNPGDVVLDPFCGCGTTIDAAQKLGRQWIGIDVTHLAIGLIEKRLTEGYEGEAEWETIGVPQDLASAQRLAADDPHQFQSWITLKLGGYPWMGGKKGGDKGVDGYFYYVGEGGKTETGVISVKAGQNVNPGMVRDLGRVMARDGHRLGLFVSAVLPTKGMTEEAASHGLVETEWGRFPRAPDLHPGRTVRGHAPQTAPARQPQPPRAPSGNPRQPHSRRAGQIGLAFKAADACARRHA